MSVVASLIRRHMKRTSKFTLVDQTTDAPTLIDVAKDESVVGWYCNPPPWENCLLMFTTDAIYVLEGGQVTRINFDGIEEYETPKSKDDVAGISVRTRDGLRFIRIAGSYGPHGRFKDAFSLMMILNVLVKHTGQSERAE